MAARCRTSGSAFFRAFCNAGKAAAPRRSKARVAASRSLNLMLLKLATSLSMSSVEEPAIAVNGTATRPASNTTVKQRICVSSGQDEVDDLIVPFAAYGGNTEWWTTMHKAPGEPSIRRGPCCFFTVHCPPTTIHHSGQLHALERERGLGSHHAVAEQDHLRWSADAFTGAEDHCDLLENLAVDALAHPLR